MVCKIVGLKFITRLLKTCSSTGFEFVVHVTQCYCGNTDVVTFSLQASQQIMELQEAVQINQSLQTSNILRESSLHDMKAIVKTWRSAKTQNTKSTLSTMVVYHCMAAVLTKYNECNCIVYFNCGHDTGSLP